MEEAYKMVLAPNGSGAIFDAINNNFRVKDTINSVDYVQIVNVDNVLNKILDPLMIGYTATKELYVTMKGCKQKKNHSPLNGVIVQKNYRYGVVDYEDIKDMPEIKNDFIENINIYLLKADKLSELCSNAENLSYLYHKDFHRHSYWDFKAMKIVKPLQPNAYRFELDITDFLTFVEPDRFGVLVVPREDEYAPVIYADNLRNKDNNKNSTINVSAISDVGSVKTMNSVNGSFFMETSIAARDLIFR